MRFNKRIFNLSGWVTLLIIYVLPYQSTDGFATKFGYPLPFLTVYNTSISTSLLKSSNINIFSLGIDMLLVYLAINFAYRLIVKVKSKI